MAMRNGFRILALGLCAFACAQTAASAQTLKLGIIAPLTGAGSPWGIAAAQAGKILAADVNAKGGLSLGSKKYKIEMIAYDDQYKAAEAVSAYNRLTTHDGVKHMFILTSPAAVALKQSIEDDKVIAYTTAATEKALDKSTRHMFRVLTTPSDYVPPFIAWIKANLKERRVSVINPNDETGWDQTQVATKLFKDGGFEVVGSELFERSVKDFGPMLTKIMATKPEIIELGGSPPASTGLIVRQARELGYKGVFTKNSGPAPQEILDAAGKEAAEGFISLLVANPGAEGYKRVAAEFKKAVGQEPNQYLISYYDALHVMIEAIRKAGTAEDTDKVLAAIPTLFPFPSVQGPDIGLGGKAIYGADQQFRTVGFVGVMKNGEITIAGEF